MDDVRDYIYSNLEWSFSSELYVDANEQIFKADKPWEEKIYELLQPETIEASGYCGGMALTLATVYNMLGYNSCELDMAVFDEERNVVASHVVTLVEIDGQWRKGAFAEPEYEGTYRLKEPETFTEYEEGYYSYVDMKPEMWTAFDELYEYFEEAGYERDVLGIYAYPYNIYWPDNNKMNIIERKIFSNRILKAGNRE